MRKFALLMGTSLLLLTTPVLSQEGTRQLNQVSLSLTGLT